MKYKDQIKPPELSWKEDGQPVSNAYGDVYFSAENGLAETDHVFIDGNDLRTRIAALSSDEQLTIFECGFGTGLNFLRTLWHWQISGSQGQCHFISLEGFPLTRDQLQQALDHWQKEMPEQIMALQEVYTELHHGSNRFKFGKGFTLDILVCDVNDLEQFGFPAKSVDAIFMDGFSPAKNPDMWQPGLCQLLYQLAKPGATLATYSVAGLVRKNLTEAGFNIQKAPGFGKKREMLRAYKAAS